MTNEPSKYLKCQLCGFVIGNRVTWANLVWDQFVAVVYAQWSTVDVDRYYGGYLIDQ